MSSPSPALDSLFETLRRDLTTDRDVADVFSYVENDPTITKTLEDFIDLMKTRVEEAEQLLVEVERRSGR